MRFEARLVLKNTHIHRFNCRPASIFPAALVLACACVHPYPPILPKLFHARAIRNSNACQCLPKSRTTSRTRCCKLNDLVVRLTVTRKANALRLRDAVLAAQMAVGFHCESAAVFMSKPARNSRNINAALDAPRREEMPQIVMRDAICADSLQARSSDSGTHRRETLWRPAVRPLVRYAFGETARVRQESRAHGAIPNSSSCIGVSTDNDFTRIVAGVEVHVLPSDLARFAKTTACVCQAFCEIGTVHRIATVARAHFRNQSVKSVG